MTWLLILTWVTGSLPSTLAEVDPWFYSRTEQEVWESLEVLGTASEDPVSIRLLDLALLRYRTRGQMYLLSKRAGRVASTYPETGLGIQALAWLSWGLPETAREPETRRELLEALKKSPHPELWRRMAFSFPDDISGILAVRLIEASERGKAAPFLDKIRSTSPETGIGAYLLLQEGNRLAEQEEWGAAVDAWLTGLLHYPLYWERSSWVERIRDGLLNSGRFVQAALVENASDEILNDLLLLRKASGPVTEEEKQQPESVLRKLIRKPSTAREIRRLATAQLGVLSATDSPSSASRTLFARLSVLSKPLLDLTLSRIKDKRETTRLAESIPPVAMLRFDRGEIPEAVSLWRFVVTRGRGNTEEAAEAYRSLIALRQAQFEMMGRLNRAFSGNPEDSLFLSLEREREASVREDLESLLNEAETFAVSAEVSQPLFDLAFAVYDAYAVLGRSDRPDKLLYQLALRASPNQRRYLADKARWIRPSEAIAILQLDSASRETPVLDADDEVLLSLYEQEGKFKEAAEIARQIALSATGTPYARKAWYKAAQLEYRAKDYNTAETILKNLRKEQTRGTPEYTETSRLLGLANFKNGNYEEAREVFGDLLESGDLRRDQENELALLDAYSYLYLQEYGTARQKLERIRSNNPSRVMRRRVDALLSQLQARE